MKNNVLKILAMFSLFIVFARVNAQDANSKKSSKQAQKEQEFIDLKPLIEGLAYTFDATKANPQGGRQIDLTTHTSYLTMTNDSLDVYLPFFGRSYNAAYGGSGGIQCSGKYTNYSMNTDEKRMNYIIKFKCKGENDTYEFSLTVSYSGSATLFVSSIQKAAISYYGQIEPIKNKE